MKELNEKQERLKKSEQTFEEVKQLWKWQQEWERLSEAYSRLQSEKGSVLNIKQLLKASAEAAKVMPYLETLTNAESEETAAKQALTGTERSFQIAREEEAASKDIFEHAKKERSDLEPKLLEERQHLHQGAQILERLRAVKQTCDDGKRRLAEVKGKLDTESMRSNRRKRISSSLKHHWMNGSVRLMR
ncbi:hypothetical protein QS257_15295 [Terrilactibacillus sp. S3-3]|nr:hypothetical protein QS257_15295 [Terrilactibacillus sp. S3-3]